MDILWWHWLVLGMVLIGLELVVPSFTIIWFGLGAVLVSVVLALAPGYSLAAQILTWTVASALFTFAWFRFFNPRTSKTFAGSSKGAVVGEIGLVIRAAEPYAKGVVEVEGHVLKVAKTVKKETR